jgi:hypothetical protein
MAKKQVKVVWKTIRGESKEARVDEDKAQAYMDRLRSMPDVKTESVRLSMWCNVWPQRCNVWPQAKSQRKRLTVTFA